MNEDRNISIARLAYRAKLIDRDQLALATMGWAKDKSASMEDVLESLGWLDAEGRAILERLGDHDSEAGPDLGPALSTLAAMAELRGAGTTADGPSAPGCPSLTVADHLAAGETADIFASGEADTPTLNFEPSSSNHVRLTPLEEAASGEHRHRYIRTRIHAKGGIGQVWLARDGDLGREVALKELRPEQVRNPAAWSRFVEEARITGQLEHPGIVPIYELAVEPERGKTFYTMRFIRGRTLNEAIRSYHKNRAAGKDDPLELAGLLDAFVALCNTVAYANSRGVIHRDLKGQNVVLGDFGEVMLLDWGIAKLVDATTPEGSAGGSSEMLVVAEGDSAHDATVQGQVLGTPFYMAPEQAEGRIEEIDQRTDVYGLGAILYELLTGRPPHGGDTTVEVLRRVVEELPQPPREVAPATSRALEAICSKAMAKRREDRYPSALELAEDVRRWQADEPVSVLREPWPTRLARWSKRHRSAVASAAALILMAVVALSISTVLIGRERDEARRQRQQARRAVDDNYTRVAELWLEDRLDPLQREFLEKALAYYRDFAGDSSARPEQGRAYLRLGDVLRKLGRHGEAESAYRKSIEILERLALDEPGSLEHREWLAEATFRLGGERAGRGDSGQLVEAQRLFERAVNIQEKVLDKSASTARRMALGRSLTSLAELRHVIGQADASEAALRRAIGLLEKASTDDPAEVAPRQELAVASEALGRLLGERGRLEEARAALERSVQEFEKIVAQAPNLPNPRDGLAKACNSLGLLLRKDGKAQEPEELIRKQVAVNQRLAEDFPARPEYRRALARGLQNLGIVCRGSNRGREAEGYYRQALAINRKLSIEDPDTWKFRRDEANCLQNLGEILIASARGDAETPLRQSIEIYDALVDQAPQVPAHRVSAASVRLNLGVWLRTRGRNKEATEVARRSVKLLEGLAAEDQADLELRRVYAQSLNSLGDALNAEERYRDAEDVYRKAANAYDQLVGRPGANREDRLDQANALSTLGNNRVGGGLPGAEEPLRRSVALLGALAAEETPSPRLRTLFAAARSNLGDHLRSTGKLPEAEEPYGKAVEAFQALAAEFPNETNYDLYLGQALTSFGTLRVAQGQPKEARKLFERALAAERAVLAANPGSVEAQGPHLLALENLAQVCLEEGDYLAAAKAGEEFARGAADRVKARSSIARLLALCVPKARADASLTEDRRALQAGDLEDRAIALLRQALEEGDAGAIALIDDPAFDPIRQRDGFKLLALVARAKLGRAGPEAPATR